MGFEGNTRFSKRILNIKCIILLFIFILIVGSCNDPIKIKTAQKYEPLAPEQHGKKVLIAPVVLICEDDQRDIQKGLLKKSQRIPSQVYQDDMKHKILSSICQRLESKGFIIPEVNQKVEELLNEVSIQHVTLISQYKPKDSFQSLLSNISELSDANGVILAEVLITYGTTGHVDPIFSGTSSENTDSTSLKIAYISTKDTQHKWYSEIYMRDIMQESDIEKILKKLMKNN